MGGGRERTEGKVSEGEAIKREVSCQVQGQAR